MNWIASTLTILIAAILSPVFDYYPATNVDEQRVIEAVSDYVEGIYEVQPERIERSVSPSLRKVGYWRPTPDAEYGEATEMSFEQLKNLAASWNRNGQVDAETAPKEITVLDVLDKTATAKLVAFWGIDYLHLVKVGDTWQIENVIWQSHPAE